MAQHKAPTAVTFAPTRESTGFGLWVERYWKVATIVVLTVTGLILYREYSRHSARRTHDRSWEQLMGVAREDRTNGQLSGVPEDLLALETRLRGTDAAPWALYVAASSAAHRREWGEAKRALSALREGYPDHLLVSQPFRIEESEGALTPADRLARRIDAQEAWSAAHPTLYDNPELPADAPKVRLKTDRGDIVVGLYSELAPLHVENFLKVVREGVYAGTKFHRIVPGSLIEGGDPNSVQGDPATWGTGGTGTEIDKEENPLKHFPGVLSASKGQGGDKSSGSLFSITVGPAHHLDGRNVIFGKVLEGLDVVQEIERGPVVQGTSRPQDPVAIQSAEVL